VGLPLVGYRPTGRMNRPQGNRDRCMGVGDTLATGQPMHRVFLERHCLWLVGLGVGLWAVGQPWEHTHETNSLPTHSLFHMPNRWLDVERILLAVQRHDLIIKRVSKQRLNLLKIIRNESGLQDTRSRLQDLATAGWYGF
jgi:hypothetical protein